MKQIAGEQSDGITKTPSSRHRDRGLAETLCSSTRMEPHSEFEFSEYCNHETLAQTGLIGRLTEEMQHSLVIDVEHSGMQRCMQGEWEHAVEHGECDVEEMLNKDMRLSEHAEC